jgi:hypothetical protein
MWLLIAAVVLLLMELALKKLVLPVGTVLRVQRSESGVSDRQTSESEIAGELDERAAAGGEEAHAAEPELTSYEQLRKQVADAYRRDTATKREFKRWYEGGEHNPVAERKIHIARKRRK